MHAWRRTIYAGSMKFAFMRYPQYRKPVSCWQSGNQKTGKSANLSKWGPAVAMICLSFHSTGLWNQCIYNGSSFPSHHGCLGMKMVEIVPCTWHRSLYSFGWLQWGPPTTPGTRDILTPDPYSYLTHQEQIPWLREKCPWWYGIWRSVAACHVWKTQRKPTNVRSNPRQVHAGRIMPPTWLLVSQ
jgi:hypothetical protein